MGMNILVWYGLLGTAVLVTAAAVLGQAQMYASLMMLAIWPVVGWGATDLVITTSCCQHSTTNIPVAILAFVNAAVGLVFLGAAIAGSGDEASEAADTPLGDNDLQGGL